MTEVREKGGVEDSQMGGRFVSQFRDYMGRQEWIERR